jgi:HEPN domain-containing protein
MIKKIADLSKNIEDEGTVTRYGIIVDGVLISPEEKYDKAKTDEWLDDLEKILIIFKDLFEEKPDFEVELTTLSEFIVKIEELEE